MSDIWRAGWLSLRQICLRLKVAILCNHRGVCQNPHPAATTAHGHEYTHVRVIFQTMPATTAGLSVCMRVWVIPKRDSPGVLSIRQPSWTNYVHRGSIRA